MNMKTFLVLASLTWPGSVHHTCLQQKDMQGALMEDLALQMLDYLSSESPTLQACCALSARWDKASGKIQSARADGPEWIAAADQAGKRFGLLLKNQGMLWIQQTLKEKGVDATFNYVNSCVGNLPQSLKPLHMVLVQASFLQSLAIPETETALPKLMQTIKGYMTVKSLSLEHVATLFPDCKLKLEEFTTKAVSNFKAAMKLISTEMKVHPDLLDKYRTGGLS